MFDLYYDIKFVSGNLVGIEIKDLKVSYPMSSMGRIIEQCEMSIATGRVSSNAIITGYRIVEKV